MLASSVVETHPDYAQFVDLQGPPLVSPPVEQDSVRRFAQAIMDDDPSYFDQAFAASSKAGVVTAPPLFPIHAFRRPSGTPDELEPLTRNPRLDGSGDMGSFLYGLPPIPMPFVRLLNGGSEIEFFRSVALGERIHAQARYKDVTLRSGKSGEMLIVIIETRFTTDRGEPLITVRQTAIWR